MGTKNTAKSSTPAKEKVSHSKTDDPHEGYAPNVKKKLDALLPKVESMQKEWQKKYHGDANSKEGGVFLKKLNKYEDKYNALSNSSNSTKEVTTPKKATAKKLKEQLGAEKYKELNKKADAGYSSRGHISMYKSLGGSSSTEKTPSKKVTTVKGSAPKEVSSQVASIHKRDDGGFSVRIKGKLHHSPFESKKDAERFLTKSGYKKGDIQEGEPQKVK